MEKSHISKQSDTNYLAENARFVAPSKCCKASPLHSWYTSHLYIQANIRVTCEWNSREARAIYMCLFCIYTGDAGDAYMHVSHLCIQIHIRVTCEWKSRAICMCLFCKYTCLVCIYTCRVCVIYVSDPYGVATVSRIDKIIGFFCRIASLLLVSFAKETYNFIDPTNCSHPI